MRLQVLLLSFGLLCCTAQEGPFRFIASRESNTITLNCRDSSESDIPDPKFWINNTMSDLRDLLEQRGERFSEISRGFVFIINRDIEGFYFCGSDVNTISQMVPLVAYPSRSIIRPSTVTVQKGQDAVLFPLVSPGMLLAQYYIDWMNSSNMETIATIQGPRSFSTLFSPANPRYTVDPNTFALTIRSVSFSDRGLYLGVLGVADPGGLQLTYTQTERLGVNLEIYVPPTFIKRLENQVVVLSSTNSGQSVTYYCIVKGFPSLEITWTHNDLNVRVNPRKYIVSTSNGGETILESSLTILDLENHDSGNVTCTGSVGANAGRFRSNSSTASLSVLGQVQRVSTFITVSQTVVFRVSLVRPIAAEVQLLIKYTDSESQATVHITTTTHYTQSKDITHFEDSMPFQRFTVDVALVYRSMTGPLMGDRITYDRSLPTELSIILVTYLVPGLFLLLFLIIVAIVVIVGLCLCFGRKQGLNCCYGVNTDGEKALFLEKKILKKYKKLDDSRPEDAAGGPPNPFARMPNTPLKKSRKTWRPFCCRESAAEKNAKHTLETITELLRPTISAYTNLSNVYTEGQNEIVVGSDDMKDSLSRTSNEQSCSSAGITGKETCL